MSGPADGRGAWGPTTSGGRRFRRLRRLLLVSGIAAIVAVASFAVTGAMLVRTAENNIVRTSVPALEEQEDAQALNVLVVGSDSREGLTPEEIRRYKLGRFDGQRSDTVLLVSIPPDRDGVSIVHFPRDLRVDDHGTERKLSETFHGGPANVVEVLSETFDIPIHHYVEVSITGFITTVDTLGSVELCLDQPLRDRKSGADLAAGCQEVDAQGALAFVRSRRGGRGDFERIERQQEFIRAMLRRLVETRTLVDVPRLFAIVEDVAGTVTTDERLGLSQMRTLAQELRGLAEGGVPMTFVPGYTEDIGGKSYVIVYRNGADRLFDSIRAGQVIEPRGERAERAAVRVFVWTGGRVAAADRVTRTLHWAGFDASPEGSGGVDAGAVTTVYALPGHEQPAEWVAATLGAPVESLPPTVTAPEGATVVVATGDDALEDGAGTAGSDLDG